MKTVYAPFYLSFFCTLLLSNINLVGQETKSSSGLSLIDESFFFAGASTSLLDANKVELNLLSSFTSYWLALRTQFGEGPVFDRRRLTEFTSILEGYYGFAYNDRDGFSHNGRLNFGVRIKYSQRRIDNNASSSPFKVFQFKEAEENKVNIDRTYNGVTGIGLRLRIIPFENIPALVLNGGYTFATVTSEEYQRNLAADRNMFDLTASYYLKMSPNSYYLFTANGAFWHPSGTGVTTRTSDDWLFNAGSSFFLVHYFYNQYIMLYPGLSYNISFKPPDILEQPLIKTNEQVFGLVGLQYQDKKGFSVNTTISYPLLIETYSLGIEQVRASYSSITLGFRKVF